MEISITTFVNFVLANGPRRLTEVKKAKALYEAGYSPAKDFYKPLREIIVAAAQRNLSPRDTCGLIHSILEDVDARKLEHYRACIAGYKRWLGRKRIAWNKAFVSEGSKWTWDQLIVKVNPELGVSANGKPHILKLHFKSKDLSRDRLETIFHLLGHHESRDNGHIKIGILDVRRGKLRAPTREMPGIEQLLAGEAAAFQTMWAQV